MILVDIYVPMLNEQYDFKLDEHAYLADIVTQIGDILMEGISDSKMLEQKKELLLCDNMKRRVLPLDETLWQNGIGNGSHLMLV